jgi:hypothetical protein
MLFLGSTIAGKWRIFFCHFAQKVRVFKLTRSPSSTFDGFHRMFNPFCEGTQAPEV